jgi:23S rRNA pseudouridine2605 synthase
MDNDKKTIRLNKFLAQCGVASRRGADTLVFDGRVAINDIPAESPGEQVDPAQDTVLLDGKPVQQPRNSGNQVTIMMNKPTQVVTTVKDPQGRKTVMALLPREYRTARLFPVGRLDFFSEGLLLLTTDGELCHRLTHPKWHQPKIYLVTVRGTVSSRAVSVMEQGMKLAEGETLAPVKIRLTPPRAGTQQIEMTLNQGVNRQIRRMFRDLDMTILRLKRIRQGSLSLGTLKPGQCRTLDEKELNDLKESVGLVP